MLGLALLAFVAALPICAESDQNADDEPTTETQEEAASSDEPTTDTVVVEEEEEQDDEEREQGEQDDQEDQGEQDEAPKRVSLKTVYKPKPQKVRLKPVLKDNAEEASSETSAQSQTALNPDEPPRQANLDVIKKPEAKQGPAPPDETEEDREVAQRRETKVTEARREKTPEGPIDWDRILKAPASASVLRRLNKYVAEHRDSPRLPRALLRIGRINLELGNPEEALMALRAASSVAEDPVLVHQINRGLAEATTQTGQYEEALIHWGKVADQTARQDERVEALIGMGMALTAQDRFEHAQVIWRGLATLTALLEGPRATELQAATLFGQALTEELAGQSADAIGHFDELLSLYPRSPQARIAIKRVIDLREPLFE